MPTPKLNSMRLLERHKIAYTALEYHAEATDAEAVAGVLGIPANHLYKTLVTEPADGKGKPALVMIASDSHLDLKKYAARIGQKKMNMVAHAQAEQLTGLRVGGIGALALVHKNWPVYLDQAALALPYICVSAGQRGLSLRLAVADLQRAVAAQLLAEITTTSEASEE
jgi:Cys-tRNA(Pro)/Cys-tRNA(Cys) deacylase